MTPNRPRHIQDLLRKPVPYRFRINPVTLFWIKFWIKESIATCLFVMLMFIVFFLTR